MQKILRNIQEVTELPWLLARELGEFYRFTQQKPTTYRLEEM